MPCGLLPYIAMFVSTIFADNQTLINYSIYVSIAAAVVVSCYLMFVYKSEASNFIMELPQYRFQQLKVY